MSCNPKSLGDAFIIVFVDCSNRISAGDPSDDIAGYIVGRVEEDSVFGVRFVFVHDSFGIIKELMFRLPNMVH